MSELTVIVLTLVAFAIMMLLGFYIHSVLLGAGILGIVLLSGSDMLVGLLGSQPFSRTATYSLSTIPMFVLMAQFLLQAGIVKDVFYVVHRLSRGKSGPLATLSLVAGGLLGAVAGSGSASSAALGQVAMPELRRVGIHRDLSGAIAASAGSLSGIVPPSVILILYGVATETPIGAIFIAAVIPSILVLLVFIGITMVYLRRKVYQVPPRDEGSGAEGGVSSLRVLVSLVLMGTIATVVFGGIFSGIVTPTEAGALGAGAAFLGAVIVGKVRWEFLVRSLSETVKVSVMVLVIMIGAQVFGRFISLSRIPRRVIEGLEPLVESPVLLLALLGLVYLVLFMFIEGAAVILMTMPVVVPLLAAAQVDVLWFGVFVGLLCTLGLMTPPVGLSVYAVAGATGVPSGGIFRVAFVFASVAGVIVGSMLIAFPDLALWLPSQAF